MDLAHKMQPLDMLYKKSVLKKFCNIDRKTPALDSVLNKVTGLQACLLKRDSDTGVFLRIFQSF